MIAKKFDDILHKNDIVIMNIKLLILTRGICENSNSIFAKLDFYIQICPDYINSHTLKGHFRTKTFSLW